MMQLKEQWIPWNPDNKLSGEYEKNSFLDSDSEGVVITYTNQGNPKKIMKIIFRGGGLVSYRYTNETYMWEVQKACSTEGNHAYKVLNSKYLQWVREISGCMTDRIAKRTQHFVFVSSDDYIEILTDNDPEIEFEELS